MKKFMFFLVIAAGISPLFSHSLFATSTIACPVFDLSRETALPQNFRILKLCSEGMLTYNLSGLDELKVSGSSQFSEKNFDALVKILPLQSEQLIICDLREECHGFVNGLPMYWIDELNRDVTLNQAVEEIELDEYGHLRLASEAGYLLLEQDEEQAEQVALAVSQAMTERAFVEGKGHIYVRFPMASYGRPNDQLVEHFVQFVNCLSPDQWVHFHCRAGKQRTAMFLCLLDIIKNHHQVSLEDILARHQWISEVNLKDCFLKERASVQGEQERFNFICEFHAYCQQVPNFNIPWSEWFQQQLQLTNYSSAEGVVMELLEIMQMQGHTEDGFSMEEVGKNSAFFRDITIPLLPGYSINNKFNAKQDISGVVADIFDEILSDKSLRHGDRHHSHGHRRDKHSHGDKERWRGEGKITARWGDPDKGITWDVSLGGEVQDEDGNYVGGEVTQASDGVGEASVYGGQDSKKK